MPAMPSDLGRKIKAKMVGMLKLAMTSSNQTIGERNEIFVRRKMKMIKRIMGIIGQTKMSAIEIQLKSTVKHERRIDLLSSIFCIARILQNLCIEHFKQMSSQ